MRRILFTVILAGLVACKEQSPPRPNSPPVPSPAPIVAATNPLPAKATAYTYEVVRSWPHDPKAFTQGLVWLKGVLYESTGLNGQSTLRRVDLATGNVLQQVTLANEFFAEGLAALHGKLFQLTWKNGIGFVYDQETLRKEQEFTYEGEGWGLATDGHWLILSDGTDHIRFLDPITFAVARTVAVRYESQPVDRLNELEFIHGEIYANVWGSDFLVRIHPDDGRVTGVIDLRGLLPASDRSQTDVLNGIAYDPDLDRILVTGKWWPKLFEIQLKPK